jgi:hypothetical protein
MNVDEKEMLIIFHLLIIFILLLDGALLSAFAALNIYFKMKTREKKRVRK